MALHLAPTGFHDAVLPRDGLRLLSPLDIARVRLSLHYHLKVRKTALRSLRTDKDSQDVERSTQKLESGWSSAYLSERL